MPCLTQICVQYFRNIESVEMRPAPNINIIFGENGAGKSSLLEALFFLSRGKSYRTNLFRRIIKVDREGFLLFSEVRDSIDPDTRVRLGVEKRRNGDTRIRVNGENIRHSSELAVNLPALVLNNTTFELLSGGAKGRRQFFDWLVFHVKHEFAQTWKDYSRLIKQRNSLLRHDRICYSDLLPWDRELAKLGSRINELRLSCLEKFKGLFEDYLAQCSLELTQAIEVEYFDGLKSEDKEGGSFEDRLKYQLHSNFERDVRLGYSSVGPHRSELRVLIGRVNAGEVLSRGQQKTLITALYFTAAHLFREINRQSPVVLIDDLAAELDAGNQDLVINWVYALDCQAFITCINKDLMTTMMAPENNYKLFHVEHGTVQEVQVA